MPKIGHILWGKTSALWQSIDEQTRLQNSHAINSPFNMYQKKRKKICTGIKKIWNSVSYLPILYISEEYMTLVCIGIVYPWDINLLSLADAK